jgi:multimeric flavodoxin WrbA
MATALGICGSARKKGSTATLLQELLDAVGVDSELVQISELDIKFCLGCLNCMKKQGKCAIKDDAPELLEKLLSAKVIVVASPNYYYTVSGLIKNVIDRSISLSYRGIGKDTGLDWHGNLPFVDKVGGIVITQAAFGGEKVEDTFQCFFEWSGLRWMGTVIASVGSGHVKDYPEHLEEGRNLGRKIRAGLGLE